MARSVGLLLCVVLRREWLNVPLVVLALLTACGANEGSGAPDALQPAPFDGVQSDDCIDAIGGDQRLECEGLTFDLSVPDECLQHACGLIADVHGAGTSGDVQDQHSGLRALGRIHGYIVVNPWARSDMGWAAWQRSDDARVMAFMRRVIAAFDVDARRVHMSGYSQGGFMTWRFLKQYSDVLASVAPLAAGGDSGSDFAGDLPDHRLSIFYVHGTTDTVVDFGQAISTRDVLTLAWSLEETELLADDSEHVWTRYEDAEDNVFEFVQHNWISSFDAGDLGVLNGHCYPGDGQSRHCEGESDLNWGEAVIRFFIDHPRGK